MARHHKEIVAKAATMLRERGIDGLSVADVMEAAGLTHGGFYRHFASKDALVAEATTAAFASFVERIERNIAKNGPESALRGYVADYLSLGHIANPAVGCPIAAYGADVARQGAAIRDAYAQGLGRMCSAIAGCFADPPARGQRLTQEIISTMVGAVVTARATGDQQLARSYLAAARATVDQLIERGTLLMRISG
jgi:TetR/AcrR family transcriptional repressor of nem operon